MVEHSVSFGPETPATGAVDGDPDSFRQIVERLQSGTDRERRLAAPLGRLVDRVIAEDAYLQWAMVRIDELEEERRQMMDYLAR
jgi:hypothetical protein